MTSSRCKRNHLKLMTTTRRRRHLKTQKLLHSLSLTHTHAHSNRVWALHRCYKATKSDGEREGKALEKLVMPARRSVYPVLRQRHRDSQDKSYAPEPNSYARVVRKVSLQPTNVVGILTICLSIYLLISSSVCLCVCRSDCHYLPVCMSSDGQSVY